MHSIVQGRNSANALCTFSRREEILSVAFHGCGVLLSIIGSVVLMTFAIMYADALVVFSCSVFSVSMVLLYSASTVYHAVQSEVKKN